MGMEMKLSLKLTQKLVMTPMLQKAIKLLPMARWELAQLVSREIMGNPVNLSGISHNTASYAEAGGYALCLKDSGYGKVRIVRFHNDQLQFFNVADDDDIIPFTKAA